MADYERLYQEYLKVLKEPDSPHKRRVMRRIDKYLNSPNAYVDNEYRYGDVTVTIGDMVEAHRLAEDKYIERAESKAARSKRDRDFLTYKGTYRARPGYKKGVAPDEEAILGIPQIGMVFRSFGDRDPYPGAWTSPVAFLDIETGKGNRPLSIAAIKGYINKNTGEFFYTQGFERYYVPQDPSDQLYNMALETHKITRARALAYRQAQGADYPEVYNPEEMEQLLSFLKGTVVVGQNTLNFDFNHLGIANALQLFRTIDTFLAAENMEIPVGMQNLNALYKNFMGMSMIQAGYVPHFGFHDVLATAEVFSGMYRMDNREGRDIRYIMSHANVSHAPFEWVHNSSVVTGGYRRALEVSNYMEGETIDEQMGAWTDENGNVHVPSGYSTSDPAQRAKDAALINDVNTTAIGVTEDLLIGLTTAMNKVQQTMTEYVKSQNQPLIQYLANRSAAFAKSYLDKRGIAGSHADYILELAGDLREEKEKEQFGNLNTLVQDLMYTGKLSAKRGDWYQQVIAGGPLYTSKELRRMLQSDVRREAYDKRQAQEAEEQVWWDVKNEYDLNKFAEHLNVGWNDEAIKKWRYVDKAEKAGMLWGSNASELRSSAEYLAGTYDDLVDATDAVIKKNQELLGVYEKIGQIKPYDINQLIGAARGQWNGITGAAGGVIPKFILNPVSRLGDAAFNAIDRSVSPWNAVQRTWNSGIGSAVTGALTAGMGSAGLGIGMALTGGVNAISQVVGNRAQAKIEMAGLAIQNNLNVLGALVSWIATPFQLLHKAAKTLIGSFSGLSLGINKFMQNSIGLMSQMGNPLEQLTGVGYRDYIGTTAVDMATLNRSGTLNSIIENTATQSRALYGLGQANTTRMIASSILGVFDDVYTPTTDVAGAYYNTANKILRSMQGQSAEQQANTLFWATNLDSYMAGLIRTAMLLGETDVRNFTDPSRSGMYWNPLDKGEEAGFRRTQYEFGSATQQLNFSKMRLGNKLWEAVGKDLYNGFNRLVDAAAGGNWAGVLEEAKNMWGELKEKVKGAWDALTGDKTSTGFWGKFADGFNKASDTIVTWGAKIAKSIITIWDDIFLAVLKKAQGLIAYLSTVSVKPYIKEDGSFGLKMESIGTAESVDRSSRLYKTSAAVAGRTEYKLREGMDAYHDIANIIYGDKLTSYMQYDVRDARYKEGAYWKSTLTGDKVTADAVEWLRSGKDLDLSEYGYYIPGFKNGKVTLQDVEDLTTLFDALSKASIKGNDDWWKVAAWQMGRASRWKLEDYGDRTGLYSLAKTTFKDDVEPFIGNIIDRSAEKLTIRLEISDASGSVKQSMDVNKGNAADSNFLTWLQDLLPDDLRLRVVTH